MNSLKNTYFSKLIVDGIEGRKSTNIRDEDEIKSFLDTLEDEGEIELFKAYINELGTQISFVKASVEIYRSVKNTLNQNDFTIFEQELRNQGSVTMAESYIDRIIKVRIK